MAFLAQSARNLGPSADGGRLIADHLSAILAAHDPEPQAAFAVLGPAGDGWEILLHGPVQAWDGVRWLSPTPGDRWIRSEAGVAVSLAITGAGFSPPAVSAGSQLDLESGVVPGGGFVMLAVAGKPAEPDRPVGATPPGEADKPEPWEADTEPDPSEQRPEKLAAAEDLDEPEADPEIGPAPQGAVSASALVARSAGKARPPLPADLGPDPLMPGLPVVAGVLCPRGHLNRGDRVDPRGAALRWPMREPVRLAAPDRPLAAWCSMTGRSTGSTGIT